jgi:hypothetical protein
MLETLQRCYFNNSSQTVDCRMQCTERADNREDCESQSDLDYTVARELPKRWELRLIP